MKPWGDEYSNFNAGKILLILEGIAGLSYSVVDRIFTVSDHMPETWDFMDFSVPTREGDQTSWTSVKVTRELGVQGQIHKTITVTGNTQSRLNIQPWLEGKALVSAPEGYSDQAANGHLSYEFDRARETSVSVVIQE